MPIENSTRCWCPTTRTDPGALGFGDFGISGFGALVSSIQGFRVSGMRFRNRFFCLMIGLSGFEVPLRGRQVLFGITPRTTVVI